MKYKILECKKGADKWYEVWHQDSFLFWKDRWVQDSSSMSGPIVFFTLQEAKQYADREYAPLEKNVVLEGEY